MSLVSGFEIIVLWCSRGAGVLSIIVLAPLASAATDVERDGVQSRVIEEIVVTSRRQAESLQDVPVSVTAFNQQDIERIQPSTLRDFDGLMPNVFIGMNTAGPSAGAVFIRGLGYADIEKTQSVAVGVVVDGVFQPSSTGQLIDTFDVAQIEVNRGPQGVLYGKNTTGGTIVVKRHEPVFNEFGVDVSAQIGDFEQRILKGRVNVPLIDDRLALKVGATVKEQDGFYDNLTTGCEECAGDVEYDAQTVALKFAPLDNFEAILSYDRIRDDGDIPPQDPRFDGDDPFETLADLTESQELDVDKIGLQLEWALNERLTLEAITGWEDSEDTVVQDFDGATQGTIANPLVQLHTLRDQDLETFSQEIRLSGDITDTLRFTAGGLYWDSELDFRQGTNQVAQLQNAAFPVLGCSGFAGLDPALAGFFITNPNPEIGDAFCQTPQLGSFQIASHEEESVALFGALYWQVVPDLEVSAGIRWLDEDKDFSSAFFKGGSAAGIVPAGDITPPQAPAGPATNSLSDSGSWDDVLLKFTADYALTDRNALFATYAEGFRSGGFSIRAADPATAAFDSEDVWSVEVGSKNRFFNERLTVNLAAFYTELDGQQFSSIITTPGVDPGTTTLVNNADDTEIYGFEAEISADLHENFRLLASAGIQDAERQAFTIDSSLVPIGPGGTAGPAGVPFDVPAEQVARSPDWNWSVTGIYERMVAGNPLSLSVTGRGQDNFVIVSSITGAPVSESSYNLMDARLGYSFTMRSGDRVSVSAFGKNLTDTEYLQQSLPLGPEGGFQGWAPPRTWGLELGYSH